MRLLNPLLPTAAFLVVVTLSGCMQRDTRPDNASAQAAAEPAAFAPPPAEITLDPALAGVCARARAVVKSRTLPTATTPVNADLYAALYQQQALEYRANALATYRAAAAALPARLAEQRAARSGKPPVVVFDLDETVLDNSPFQGRTLHENREYDETLWDCWVGKQEARLVPGADVLFRAMAVAGVRGRFITNRRCVVRSDGDSNACPQLRETMDNLNRLLAAAAAGYLARPEEFLLHDQAVPETSAQTWSDSEKKFRRAFVAARFDPVMLLGDDLGDFLDDAKSSSATARQQMFEAHDPLQQWGRAWFMLPNAMYGSWQRALSKDAQGQPQPIGQAVEAFAYP